MKRKNEDFRSWLLINAKNSLKNKDSKNVSKDWEENQKK